MLRIEMRRCDGGLTFREAERVAQKRVKPGRYFISRHGGWFRPGAQGYTVNIAEAGIYDADEARQYIGVDGLSVVPVEDMAEKLTAQIADTERQLDGLRSMLALIVHQSPDQAKEISCPRCQPPFS